MKVLVTGARGIVMKHLIPRLVEDSSIESIVGISRKADYFYEWHPYKDKEKYIECCSQLEIPAFVSRLLSVFKPNVIFNFAAVSTSSSSPFEVWKNTNILLNLLEYSKNRQVRFINASSIVVNSFPPNVYSISKSACEELLFSYKQIYDNISGVNIRFPAVVGSGASHGLLKDLVRKVQSEDKEIVLFGKEPGSIKPFIYIYELVEYIHAIFTNPKKFTEDSLTLSPPDNMSVKDVAQIVMEVCEKKKNLVWDESKVWPGDQKIVRPANWPGEKVIRTMRCNAAIRLAAKDIINEQNN